MVAVGSAGVGTGVPSGMTIPTGHTTNDILLLFVQTCNEVMTAPAGYTQLGPQVGLGVAATALSTRLSVFWKRDGGSETVPTLADSGDHTTGIMMAVRGCPTTGDPFHLDNQNRKTTASTTGTSKAGETTIDNCLVVAAFAHAIDTVSAVFSGWTNASLTNITEQIDVSDTSGNGGGIGVATGTLATAGPFNAWTNTETSTVDVSTVFTMIPADTHQVVQSPRGIEVQTFHGAPGAAGIADTWTKPTGAKWIEVMAIGGGGAGSSGRNAATAAGGGGGGGGGLSVRKFRASDIAATMTVTPANGGTAPANNDGAVGSVGGNSTVVSGGVTIVTGKGGDKGAASATGAGGAGGSGGGVGASYQPVGAAATLPGGGSGVAEGGARGGTGATTAAAGSEGEFGGAGGAGGGTSQATSAGGVAIASGGGGGGGRAASSGAGTGGSGGGKTAGGATVGAAGVDSAFLPYGGSGAAGGQSGAGTGIGGAGGYPGAGGGGGGSESGAVTGGKGGDGCVVIVTYF